MLCYTHDTWIDSYTLNATFRSFKVSRVLSCVYSIFRSRLKILLYIQT